MTLKSFPSGLLAIAVPAGTLAAATCESLLSLKLKDASVTTAENVPVGAFEVPGTKITVKPSVASCRVALMLTPSTDSDIKSEGVAAVE